MNLLLGVGEHLGDYRIEALLGRGGMGVVYLASKPPLDRRVALKVLPGGFASERAIWRLRREARVLGRLAHPGLVRVYDAGCAGATPFYAMEWVDGDTLRARLDGLPRERDERHPEVQTLVRALVQVASALACAHAAGVVHRDVAPHNILLSYSGEVKLGDFGIARAERRAQVTTEASSAVASATCPSSSSRATPSTAAPTSTRSASCSTRCWRTLARSKAPPPVQCSTRSRAAHRFRCRRLARP
jgi:serine/threonine protein kinase